MNIDIVIIGKNCEQILDDCIKSVINTKWVYGEKNIFYVDSFSTDHSMQIANNYKDVKAFLLNEQPASAAKGRNYGATLGHGDIIQFVDCDVVLGKNWLDVVYQNFIENENLAGMKGILKEKNSRQNIYHFAASLEWNESNESCEELGGICAIRRKCFEAVNGYRNIESGEDPDLSRRLIEKGYKLKQDSEVMGVHDIRMNEFKVWMRRSIRTGWTYASIGHKRMMKKDFFWIREQARILIRGLGAVLAIFGGAYFNQYLLGFLLLLVFVFQPTLTSIPRMAKKFHISLYDSFVYSLHCSIILIPQFIGYVKYWLLKPKSDKYIYICLLLLLCSCDQVEPRLPEESRKKTVNTSGNIEFKTEYEVKETKYSSVEMIQNLSKNNNVEYKIGPGDIISLQVWNRSNLSIPEMTVGPDGSIQVPRVGSFIAKGKTCNELNDEIKKSLSKLYESPEVSVRIIKYNNNRAFVLGRVASPGLVTFQGQGTLLEALSIAGGLPVLAKKAFLTKCAIIRSPNTILWIDIKELLAGNMGLNANIYNNDIIYIPESGDKMVYVMGEVSKPGALLLKEKLTYLDALMMSGGPTDSAKLSQAFLVRSSRSGYTVKKIGLHNMIKHGDLSTNYLLQDNDIIYVSKSEIKKLHTILNNTLPFLQVLNLGATTLNALGETKVSNQQ